MTAAAVAAQLGGRRILKRDVRSELDLAALVRLINFLRGGAVEIR